MELICPVVVGQTVVVRLEEDASVDDGAAVDSESETDLIINDINGRSAVAVGRGGRLVLPRLYPLRVPSSACPVP